MIASQTVLQSFRDPLERDLPNKDFTNFRKMSGVIGEHCFGGLKYLLLTPSQSAATLGSEHGFGNPPSLCLAVIAQQAAVTTWYDFAVEDVWARYLMTVTELAGQETIPEDSAQLSKRFRSASYFAQVLEAFEPFKRH